MRIHTDWLLTAERAAVHLPTATAVIADLHLGYEQARRDRGEAVPDAGLDEVLAALQSLVFRHEVQRLVIAGDLFEASGCDKAMEELFCWLREVGLELTGIVPGNHDRGLTTAPPQLPILAGGCRLGGWQVVHGDGTLPAGKVLFGHVHPCFRWGHISAPCYLVGEDRIILPAFSPDAAGVNVLRGSSWAGYRCCVIADDEVLDFGDVQALKKAISDHR